MLELEKRFADDELSRVIDEHIARSVVVMTPSVFDGRWREECSRVLHDDETHSFLLSGQPLLLSVDGSNPAVEFV